MVVASDLVDLFGSVRRTLAVIFFEFNYSYKNSIARSKYFKLVKFNSKYLINRTTDISFNGWPEASTNQLHVKAHAD